MKEKKEKLSSDITMTIKQEKLTNKILELQSDYDYLQQTMQATQLMLNFAKGQVDVYQRMTRTRDEDLNTLDCNQDFCNEG